MVSYYSAPIWFTPIAIGTLPGRCTLTRIRIRMRADSSSAVSQWPNLVIPSREPLLETEPSEKLFKTSPAKRNQLPHKTPTLARHHEMGASVCQLGDLSACLTAFSAKNLPRRS
jgi:hypothetical protein